MTTTETIRPHPQRKADRADWRSFLNSAEAVEVEALEVNARDLDEKRRGLSRELLLWRSRCLQRRREADLKKARAAKRGKSGGSR